MLGKLLGQFNTQVQRTQYFIKDNDYVDWRKLPIYRWSFIQGPKEKPVLGWPNKYRMQYRFSGYKNLGADMVTPCYERDIFLELVDILDANEKWGPGDNTDKPMAAKVANMIIHIEHEQKPPGMILNAVTWCLGGVLVLMGLAFFIVRVTS